MREKFTRQSSDERGVSPVIGVILMVAITVILAAVIGFFVLGLGNNTQSAPQASFSYDGSNIVMDGGDSIDPSTLTISSGGTEKAGDVVFTGGSDISAGSSGSYSASSGNTIRIIWNNPSGDSSQTIASIDV